MTNTEFVLAFKAEVIAQYRQQKEMADKALKRVDDHTFFVRLTDEEEDHSNSIAILVKHISGNLRSRWSDFLTSDGEKPDRHREREFMHEKTDDRAAIMGNWEAGWQTLFAALESLSAEDFGKTITIRTEAHSIIQAILRNLLHTTHHIGQIDLMATALE